MPASQTKISLYGIVQDFDNECAYLERLPAVQSATGIVASREVSWLGHKTHIRLPSSLICTTPLAAIDRFLALKIQSVTKYTELLGHDLIMISEAKKLCNSVTGHDVYDLTTSPTTIPDLMDAITQFRKDIKA